MFFNQKFDSTLVRLRADKLIYERDLKQGLWTTRAGWKEALKDSAVEKLVAKCAPLVKPLTEKLPFPEFLDDFMDVPAPTVGLVDATASWAEKVAEGLSTVPNVAQDARVLATPQTLARSQKVPTSTVTSARLVNRESLSRTNPDAPSSPLVSPSVPATRPADPGQGHEDCEWTQKRDIDLFQEAE